MLQPQCRQRMGITDDFAIDVSGVEMPQQAPSLRLERHGESSGGGRKDQAGRRYDASTRLPLETPQTGIQIGLHNGLGREMGILAECTKNQVRNFARLEMEFVVLEYIRGSPVII